MSTDRESRLEQRYRGLGSRAASCRVCGEKDPFTLSGVHPHCICYECRSRQDGRSAHEAHHFAGRRNDPLTVPLLGNVHRILSDMQRQWPERTLRNPDGSPLLKAAASIRGWLDILRFLIDRGLSWIPPFLERLDSHLQSQIGSRWWDHIDIEEDNDEW